MSDYFLQVVQDGPSKNRVLAHPGRDGLPIERAYGAKVALHDLIDGPIHCRVNLSRALQVRWSELRPKSSRQGGISRFQGLCTIR